jgi:hypothetical protein
MSIRSLDKGRLSDLRQHLTADAFDHYVAGTFWVDQFERGARGEKIALLSISDDDAACEVNVKTPESTLEDRFRRFPRP